MIPAVMLAVAMLPAAAEETAAVNPSQMTSGYGAGPGMMGPGGQGMGPGYGWGQGMGPGYGQGPGMGRGMGPGYGQGQGMGPGYGPGQGMGPGYGQGRGMGPGMMMGPGMGLGPIWALNLTDEQRQSIDTIMQEQQQTHMQLMSRMMEEGNKLQQLYSQPQWDARAIGEVYDRIFETQRNGIVSMIEARNQIREQLTEEQRQQLQQYRWQ